MISFESKKNSRISLLAELKNKLQIMLIIVLIITVIPPIFAADHLEFVADRLDFAADHSTLSLITRFAADLYKLLFVDFYK